MSKSCFFQPIGAASPGHSLGPDASDDSIETFFELEPDSKGVPLERIAC